MTELDLEHARGLCGSPARHDRQIPIRRFLSDTSGSTALEYGLIMALVFLAIVTAMRFFADQTTAMYNYIGAALNRSS
jgi:pilus assembly protein Flp/PilA